MTDDPSDRAAEEGLRFFGRAAAGLSHELRNVLATVQQAAGLLDDYAAIMAPGRSVDPERFQTVTARVGRNADRGLGYIELLNWLGHSLDGPSSSLELNEIATRSVELARYRARQRRISLELSPSDGDAVVIGKTFEWVMLIHQCIESIVDRSEGAATLFISIEETPRGVAMGFEIDAVYPVPGEAGRIRSRISALADTLGGRVVSSSDDATDRLLTIQFTRPARNSGSDGPRVHHET